MMMYVNFYGTSKSVTANELTDEKAGQHLDVYLKDDTKAFYRQQLQKVGTSFSELTKALKQR